MQKLIIKKTFESPAVNFDPDNGLLEIEGKLIPENAKRFYKPILDWLDEYTQKPQSSTQVKLHFYYFNTISSKFILKILTKLDGIYKNGFAVNIEWRYFENDEDGLEEGEEFSELTSVPFEFVMIRE